MTTEKTAVNGAALTPSPDRSPGGRFAPGRPGGPGRPRGRTLTAALREIAEPDELAAKLIALAHDSKSPKVQLAAIQAIYDRLDGRPVSLSVVARAQTALPIGFDSLPESAQDAILDDVERRGLRGDPALLDDGDE